MPGWLSPASGRRVLLAGARGSGACCQCWRPARSLARQEGIYLFFSKTRCTLSKTNYGELRQRLPVRAPALEPVQQGKSAGEAAGAGPCCCPRCRALQSQQHLRTQLCQEGTAPAWFQLVPRRRCPCGFGSRASSDAVGAAQSRVLHRALLTAPLRPGELLWHFPFPQPLPKTRVFQGSCAVGWAAVTPVPELPRCFPCCHLLFLGAPQNPAQCRYVNLLP